LLDAGANPNYKDEQGTPAFFSCLSTHSGGLESLRLLAQKGADFNALDAEGAGILIRAATFSEWEVMEFFLERGVKDTATLSGKNAAAMINQAIQDDNQNSREISPALAGLAAKLNN
jgi:ankyrin repeat protein